jgi:hypothetical protein
MSEAVRTERRFGVTATLTAQARRNIMQVRNSAEWQDVLDVMEMVCIETEAALINTDAEQELEVLANHKMAKAAWQIFTHLQEKIDSEISLYLNSIATQPLVPELTQGEQDQENILDPTRPMPSEYAENQEKWQ